MKLKTFFEYSLLSLPFFAFLLGYLAMSFRHPIQELSVPHLVGQPITKAIRQLSAQQLNMRILAEKEDPDLEDGTIIQQTPAPGSSVKQYQSLHVIISKKPAPQLMPNVIGSTEEESKKECKARDIPALFYQVKSTKKAGTCIAQSPAHQKPLNNDPVIIYVASHDAPTAIMPNFKGHEAQEAKDLLALYQIQAEYVHQRPVAGQHACVTCKIIDQRPLPGSLLTLNQEKPLLIQFLVTGPSQTRF